MTDESEKNTDVSEANSDQAPSSGAEKEETRSLSDVLIDKFGETEETDGAGDDFRDEPDDQGSEQDFESDTGEPEDDQETGEREDGDEPSEDERDETDDQRTEARRSDEDLSDDDFLDDVEKGKKRHVKRRLQRLVREKKELEQAVATERGTADNYRQIEAFMASNGITAEQMAEMYRYRALLTHDPLEARKLLQTHIDALDGALGERLPADMQQKVDDGLIDESYAKEIARREGARSMQQHGQRAVQEHSAAAQVQQTAARVGEALNAWERQQLERDPDYAELKRPLLHQAMQNLRMTKGIPPSPEDGLKWAEEALSSINETLTKVRGSNGAAPVKPVRSTAGQRSSEPRYPSSMLDAVKRGARMT